MDWAYGVTTVPERRHDLLPQTLKSLAAAGFGSPHLFIDKWDGQGDLYRGLGLPYTAHWPPVRIYANWLLALLELFLRNPNADRYAIFQDDLVTYKNLRQYLEKQRMGEKEYWNLYTWEDNRAHSVLRDVPGGSGYVGWYRANQAGRGALGLVFNRPTVMELFAKQHTLSKPQDPVWGWRKIDGGVVEALVRSGAGYSEMVHNPSLVQHTGWVSTFNKHRYIHVDQVDAARYRWYHDHLAPEFKGEEFDALDLLKER